MAQAGAYESIARGFEWRRVAAELGEGTRRELNRPRSWRGLGREDLELLEWWVRVFGDEVSELHTDVCCGCVPVARGTPPGQMVERLAVAAHAFRVDAVAKVGDAWHVLECKPVGGYQALGQVLTYQWWVRECCTKAVDWFAGVICGEILGGAKPVYDHFNVRVFERGF